MCTEYPVPVVQRSSDMQPVESPLLIAANSRASESEWLQTALSRHPSRGRQVCSVKRPSTSATEFTQSAAYPSSPGLNGG